METKSALLLLNLCCVITCYPIHKSCFAVISVRPAQVLEHQTLQGKMAKCVSPKLLLAVTENTFPTHLSGLYTNSALA